MNIITHSMSLLIIMLIGNIVAFQTNISLHNLSKLFFKQIILKHFKIIVNLYKSLHPNHKILYLEKSFSFHIQYLYQLTLSSKSL